MTAAHRLHTMALIQSQETAMSTEWFGYRVLRRSRFPGRRTLLAIALAALALSPLHAQDYPSKTVTLVVPLAAGTGMDVIARLYGERLAESLGRPVIVENRPGANFVPP